MDTNLSLALQVTLVGMSLVFAAILLLWALMAALVRIAPERAAPEPAKPPDAGPGAGRENLRRRAAAAAVAVALARATPSPAPAPGERLAGLPATAFVSAWQAVMRANQLRQRGPRR